MYDLQTCTTNVYCLDWVLKVRGINERTNNIGMNLTLTSFSGWLNVSQNSKTGSTLSAEIPAILFVHTTVLCDPLYTSCIMYWKFWARWKPQAKRRNRNEEDGGMARKKLGGRNQEKKVGRIEEILRWGELDMDLDGEIDLWNIWSRGVGEIDLKSREKGDLPPPSIWCSLLDPFSVWYHSWTQFLSGSIVFTWWTENFNMNHVVVLDRFVFFFCFYFILRPYTGKYPLHSSHSCDLSVCNPVANIPGGSTPICKQFSYAAMKDHGFQAV